MGVNKKIRKQSVLKLSLPFHQKLIRIDFKNLQEPNWDEVTEEQKLDVYKFRIDVKEDDINKRREVLPVILYLANYYCCREEKNLVFWFGTQFNSTLNFTQSG